MKTRRSIHFFLEDTRFRLSKKKALRQWVANIVASNEQSLESVNFIFCSDAYLLNVNVQFLNHDYFTDIISFQANNEAEPIEGDIYISIDRVRENAKSLNISFEDELHRVMIHGILHFLGLKDKSDEEKKLMRKREDEALSLRRF